MKNLLYFTIIICITLFLSVSCSNEKSNESLIKEIETLKSENIKLKQKLSENNEFIDNLYNKIEKFPVQKSDDTNSDINVLKQENEKLKTRIREYQDFIDKMYQKIEK